MKKVIQFKNARFTLLSDITFKAEYSPDGSFIDKELFITELHGTSPTRCKTRKEGDSHFIETEKLVICYTPDINGFSKKNLHVWYNLNNKKRVELK